MVIHTRLSVGHQTAVIAVQRVMQYLFAHVVVELLLRIDIGILLIYSDAIVVDVVVRE